MVLMLLVVSLLSGGQTISEWVDAKGQPHFTNDHSSIPQGATWRVTSGPEFSLTTSNSGADAGARPVDAGTPAVKARSSTADAGRQVAGPDACTAARLRISQLEQGLQQGEKAAEQGQERERLECQRRLMTHGQPAFAACMAGRTEPAPSRSAALQQELADAQEALRQAQQRGCLRAGSR